MSGISTLAVALAAGRERAASFASIRSTPGSEAPSAWEKLCASAAIPAAKNTESAAVGSRVCREALLAFCSAGFRCH